MMWRTALTAIHAAACLTSTKRRACAVGSPIQKVLTDIPVRAALPRVQYLLGHAPALARARPPGLPSPHEPHAIGLLRRRRRGTKPRPRRSAPAHLAATSQPPDPQPRARAWRALVRAHPSGSHPPAGRRALPRPRAGDPRRRRCRPPRHLRAAPVASSATSATCPFRQPLTCTHLHPPAPPTPGPRGPPPVFASRARAPLVLSGWLRYRRM